MSAKTLQICGTGSGVGKSVIVSALCRIFLQDGYTVSPFKAQNMALNSFVTKESGEIGRAQAVQAQACRIEPSVDMNPILLKPTRDIGAQIIVRGKPIGNMNARQYMLYKSRLLKTVRGSFKKLRDNYKIVVIEGAGSPAEINLKSHDIVNLKMARYARAPVILVGDIDKGGVFAWLIGTLALLTKDEQKMIKGFIINKFRGDKNLLKPGIDFLENRTGIKVLGVIPFFPEIDIKIPEEDSANLDNFLGGRIGKNGKVNIAVIHLPHISNFTDFDPLGRETDTALQYIKSAEALDNPDIIIIPGTKNTISDLSYLKGSGLADKILQIMKNKPATLLIGICGGFQMLGQNIIDRKGMESNKKQVKGLGILPINTSFQKDKILSQVMAQEINSGLQVSGYEIHHGRTQYLKSYHPAFKITERQGKITENNDGIIIEEGRIWGTYIHGVFDADNFRRYFLNRVRSKKGLGALLQPATFSLDQELDKLSILVRRNIDTKLLYKILDDGA